MTRIPGPKDPASGQIGANYLKLMNTQKLARVVRIKICERGPEANALAGPAL